MPSLSSDSDTTRECTNCGGSGELCINPEVHLFNPAALSFTSCPTCNGSGEEAP